MGKANIGDMVLDKVMKLADGVIGYIGEEYKNVKPFDREEIEAKERLYWYSQLQPIDMMMLRVKHGDNVLNKYIYEMKQLEKRTQAKVEDNE